MEDWIWIIFALIGFGIWIIVTVFRKAEEERQRNRCNGAAPKAAAGRGPTWTASWRRRVVVAAK